MSISNLLEQNNYDLKSNSLTATNITVNQLSVTGSSNLSSASARYNMEPQPAERIGLIGGYLIYANDPNPSFIPFTTTIPLGLYDYIQGNGQYEMIDPYTLQINVAGKYQISYQMIIVSNSPAQIVFQLLSSKYPLNIGNVPPVIGSINQLNTATLIPFPYTNALTSTSDALASFDAGDQLKLGYLVSADSEISLTSCLSINKIG